MKGILRYKNIVISLVIIIGFIFLIKNAVSKYSLTINSLKTKMTGLEKGKLLIERWNIATLYYDKLADGFFSKDPSLFKAFVEQQSKKYNINVSYLSPTRRNENFYINASINLRVSTNSYENIVKFVRSLEEKKIIIENLRIRGEAKNNRLTDMSLRTFILE